MGMCWTDVGGTIIWHPLKPGIVQRFPNRWRVSSANAGMWQCDVRPNVSSDVVNRYPLLEVSLTLRGTSQGSALLPDIKPRYRPNGLLARLSVIVMERRKRHKGKRVMMIMRGHVWGKNTCVEI